MEDDLNRQPETTKDPGLIKALWVFFSSMKTAIVLVLLVALGSVIGTIIPQGGPPEMYIQNYGQAKASLALRFSLDDVFHSSWYAFLLTLICINLTVCSINRFKLAWRRAFQPKLTARSEQILNMQVSEKLALKVPIEDVECKAVSALEEAGYGVTAVEEEGDRCVYATKGRMAIWAPYLTHLSLLVIFAGYILGNGMGFEGFTYIPEGSQTATYYPKASEQERNLGFEVKLLDFTIEYDADHNATAYKSRLQVYDKGKKVAEKTIDVNHPLSYRGITFYQESCGIEGLILKITNPDGGVARVPIRMQTQMGDHGNVYIPELVPVDVKTGGKTWTFCVHGFIPDFVPPEHSVTDLPINPAAKVFVNERLAEDGTEWHEVGWISAGSPGKYKGHKVELEQVIDYTGLQVASNPALPVVYMGFAIMLIGVFASFYIHHRVIRVRVSASDRILTIGGSSRADASIMERDIARVRDAVGK